jgi:hypothetical protein
MNDTDEIVIEKENEEEEINKQNSLTIFITSTVVFHLHKIRSNFGFLGLLCFRND